MDEYAAETGAHANNVTRLVGSPAYRLRVGDFRAIFEETEADIFVTSIAPRGSVYDGKGRFMNDTDTVTLTRAAYEDLIDARDHARAMRDIAAGAVETLTGARWTPISPPRAIWLFGVTIEA